LDIFCQSKHKCILENNPFIKNIFIDNNINFKKYDYVFYLSRSTVGENLLALKCKEANKIPLDKELTKWNNVFNHCSHTKAWQKIFDNIFDSTNIYHTPKLYLKNTPKKKDFIIFVAGTENINKSIQNIDEIIKYLQKTIKNTIYKLKIVGKTEHNINIPYDEKVINLINRTSYIECLEHISSAKLVIGAEGSLIHMSTTLGVPTIIGQYGRDFNKYSEIKNKNIFIIDIISVSFLEKSLIKILYSLSD
jgi:ADP-heptose:LPS heptosyltransferase